MFVTVVLCFHNDLRSGYSHLPVVNVPVFEECLTEGRRHRYENLYLILDDGFEQVTLLDVFNKFMELLLFHTGSFCYLNRISIYSYSQDDVFVIVSYD